MATVTRRRLLGGSAAVVAGAYGTHRLWRGATDASFESWTPEPGAWPLRRYDPANTAHSPHASPPREPPARREVRSVEPDDDPHYLPLASPDHLTMYGDGLAVFPRDGGEAVRTDDVDTPLAGFGPDGRLHAIHRGPGGLDARSAVVGYGSDALREDYRFSLDTTHPNGLTVGSHEVYVGTSGRKIRAFYSDGGRDWQVGGTMPALGDGRLYAATALGEGTVAYEERTGLDRWLSVGPKRVWSAGFIRGEAHLPAVADGRIVIGSYDIHGGAVVAYDANSGERLWNPRPFGMDVATPAVIGDRGYTAVGTDGLEDGFVAALDLTTGETIWRDEVGWYAFAPVVSDDTLVVAGEVRDGHETTAGKVRGYDSATGEVLWTHTFEAGNPDGLALVEDTVLVTSGPTLYELG